MTALLVTIDTELSAAFQRRGMTLADNIRLSIRAEASGRETGIGWQMATLERHGLKGIFFLDPLPALVH